MLCRVPRVREQAGAPWNHSFSREDTLLHKKTGSMCLPPALCTANILDTAHWQKGSLSLPFPPTCLVPHFWFCVMGFLYLKKEPLASKDSHPDLSLPAVRLILNSGRYCEARVRISVPGPLIRSNEKRRLGNKAFTGSRTKGGVL